MKNLIELALPYQRDFITAPQKRKIWLSSRQAGKSWTLAFLAAMKSLKRKNGLSLCISTGARAANELVKKCEQFAYAAQLLSKGRLRYQASADGIRFSNGSRVVSLPSGNPASLRGYTAAATFIDEAAYIERPRDVYQAIVPTLTRDPEAELVVASTPAGKSGLFWDLWTGAGDGWYRQSTTIEEAVRGGLAVDVEELRKSALDDESFEREYMCRFAESYSDFLDPEQVDWIDDLPSGGQAYLGFDVGATGDRTALVTLRALGEEAWLEDVQIMHKASYESQLERLAALHRQKQYAAGYVDMNGIGGPVAEFASSKVSRRIRGFAWTAKSKTEAYEQFRAAVFDHKFKAPKKWKAMLAADFQNVRRVVSESGRISFEAGRNGQGHSDVTSALVLAWRAFRDNPANMKAPSAWTMPSAFGPRASLL